MAKPKFDFKKLFKGKETESEELKEGRAIKSGKMTPEQYAKGEKMEKANKANKAKPKAKGYKAGGAVTKKMAMGGRADPRRSYGRGPGMAAMMGDGSRATLPGGPTVPPPARSMMAKGGGVESKGKTQGNSVSMKKKYI
jgi:hypothetical protein